LFEEDIHLDNSDDDSLNREIPSAVQYSLLHCESDDSKSWSTMVQFSNSATSVVDRDNLSELQQSSQSHLVGYRLPHSSIHIVDKFTVSCSALSSSVDFKEMIRGLLPISAHWVSVLTQRIEKHKYLTYTKKIIQLLQYIR
jgi:hypothetical protein